MQVKKRRFSPFVRCWIRRAKRQCGGAYVLDLGTVFVVADRTGRVGVGETFRVALQCMRALNIAALRYSGSFNTYVLQALDAAGYDTRRAKRAVREAW